MNPQEKRLTEEQSAFAEKHHHVVMNFLRRRQLPESEFYDVVIFRYLRAVQLYCTDPKLRKYKFEAIAFQAMDRQIKRFWRKANEALYETLSLEDRLNGNGLPCSEVVCADGFDPGDVACDTLRAEELLAALSNEQHTLLGLRLDGYSIKEIAGRMGMSCDQVEDTFSCIRKIGNGMTCALPITQKRSDRNGANSKSWYPPHERAYRHSPARRYRLLQI